MYNISKKENIGLIEVLGLAILPPRLKTELADVESYLAGEEVTIAPYHQDWADTLKQQKEADTDVTTVVQNAVGQKFQRVLEDAGVFKYTTEGQEAFDAFMNPFK